MLKYLFLVITCFSPILSFAQVSGNQVYNSHNKGFISSPPTGRKTLHISDNKLYINSSVLLNKVADSYKLSLGANQEDATAILCNQKINQRIQKFIQEVKKLGISEKDIYVDFISQTKIYDYKMDKSQSQQVEMGYEVKKNIILSFKQLNQLSQIIELAAAHEIYDIIKVDYIDLKTDLIYEEMFKAAKKVIEQRKERYLKHSNLKSIGNLQIQSEQFIAVQPQTQYKQYQAFESSQIQVHRNRYSNQYLQKEARKNRTFYYEGIPTNQFDLVIHPEQTTVSTQYVLHLNCYFPLHQ